MFNDDVFSLADDVTTVTIGGGDYRAIVRRATKAEQQTLHGIEESSVTVFTVEPTALPVVGASVTFDATDYRIFKAELRAHETRWAVFTTSDPAATPPTETISVIAITSANTEYSLNLGTPTNVQFRCRDSSSTIRWALTSGHVASPTDPYHTLKARSSQSLSFDGATTVTLYAASSTSNAVLEILSR
jgi:hypothetical protein